MIWYLIIITVLLVMAQLNTWLPITFDRFGLVNRYFVPKPIIVLFALFIVLWFILRYGVRGLRQLLLVYGNDTQAMGCEAQRILIGNEVSVEYAMNFFAYIFYQAAGLALIHWL